MGTLNVGGAAVAEELSLSAADLGALAPEYQVPDVSELVAGRAGAAVRLAGLAALAGVDPDGAARFVHVESADGGFTANVALEQALAGGLILYALDGAPLPARFGGPFRLLFVDSEDCSVNVKFLGRVEFLTEPGSHTAACVD